MYCAKHLAVAWQKNQSFLYRKDSGQKRVAVCGNQSVICKIQIIFKMIGVGGSSGSSGCRSHYNSVVYQHRKTAAAFVRKAPRSAIPREGSAYRDSLYYPGCWSL